MMISVIKTTTTVNDKSWVDSDRLMPGMAFIIVVMGLRFCINYCLVNQTRKEI